MGKVKVGPVLKTAVIVLMAACELGKALKAIQKIGK